MRMKHILPIAAAASLAMLAQVSFAQSTSRADVKAETRAAEAAGTLTPPGVGHGPEWNPNAATPSSKTRAEQKANMRAAEKAGKLDTTNERNVVPPAKTEKSTVTRASVKAKAVAAEKAGQITSGEQEPGLPPKK